MESGTSVIVAGLLTAFATIAAAIVTKHGLKFWEKGEEVHFSASLHRLASLSGGTAPQADPEVITQDLTNAVLAGRGHRCTLQGDYRLRGSERSNIDGRLTAKGYIHNGTAYLLYKIEDVQRHIFWYGVMLLYVPELGHPWGYILCKSIRSPTKSYLLHMECQRH